MDDSFGTTHDAWGIVFIVNRTGAIVLMSRRLTGPVALSLVEENRDEASADR
jgi:hypothetical protein